MTALHQPKPLSVGEFLAFVEHRSAEERWELIDGIATMMSPPTIGHQRIARNVERALNDVLDVKKPDWCAEHEVGIELAQFANFRPEPDVVVVDTEIDTRERHADRFYCVIEVVSKSDKPTIEAKTAFYQSHAANRAVVLIRQDEVQVVLIERQPDGTWATSTLKALDDVFALADVGPICTLGVLYKGTHLVRAELRVPETP